jgi:hypothetical protein
MKPFTFFSYFTGIPTVRTVGKAKSLAKQQRPRRADTPWSRKSARQCSALKAP